MNQKKTKIICTISDKNCSSEFINKLYRAGMNVVRINSAHLTPEGAQIIVNNTRAVSNDIAILVDTKGPEVRLTAMDPEDGFEIKEGQKIEIFNNVNGICTQWALFTNCKTFVEDVPVGARVLIDDGDIALKVVEKNDVKLICEAESSGRIKGRKSVNTPNVHINLPSVSEKDKEFILWAIKANIDFIAHSFVRNKEDLFAIHRIIKESQPHGAHLKIISKIENQAGVDNLEEILSYCYGVMVARGDLGVEIPAERIPGIQRSIVNKCRTHKKPVIIATQMLHTMISHPRPTRAEVTDVSNAIFQSTDAIMLSGETANGSYPIEAVETMYTIAKEVEKDIAISLDINLEKVSKPIAAVLAKSIVSATQMLPIKAIVFDTETGRMGRYLSEFRPKVPLYAMCYNSYTKRELALSYDVYPFDFERQQSKEEFIKTATEVLLENKCVCEGDLIGIVGGNYLDNSATYMEITKVVRVR
jgi:pyruvate kinase